MPLQVPLPMPNKRTKATAVPTVAFAKLAGATALLTFVLVVLGGTVRVFDAGVSCPDWPTCYGHWWPFPVDPATGYTNFQVFLEWFHRLVASVVGGLTLVLAVWAYRLRTVNAKLFPLMVVTLLVLALQVKLGGLTVLLQNVNWSVAIHLGNALIFYAMLLSATMLASRPVVVKPTKVSHTYKWALSLLTASVFCTVLMGAMVSKSFAGGVCGGLPDCLGQWLPYDLSQLLHMKHRYLAFTTLALTMVLFAASRREAIAVSRSAKNILVVVLAQITVGIVLLYSFGYYADYYRFLSAFHLAMATVVFTFCVAHWGKLWWGPKPAHVKTMPFHS